MKKLISLLLALLMIFSIATVAFAADEPADPADTSTTEETADEGSDFDWQNISLWEAKFGFKVGKILLKLVKAFVKVAIALRLIDKNEIAQKVIDMFDLAKDSTETPATPAEPAVE